MNTGIRLLTTLTLLATSWMTSAEQTVNIYSARQENLIKPLLDRFSASSGISVQLVTGKADALLQRLQSEARNSPADLLITTDAGRLYRAKQAGVLQTYESPLVDQAVPAQYRDPERFWVGLSLRARPIFYAVDRVDPSELSTYEALAEAKWRGRICIRSSNNIYNQSLVASMLASDGREATSSWVQGLVRNFARRPTGGDRDQIKAAAAGMCDIAIANTYYFARMQGSDDQTQKQASEAVAIFWPNQQNRGTHVNVSGAGLTRHAPNREAALALLEYMVQEEAQRWYAEVNHEYPVREGIAPSEVLRAWGEFKPDSLNLAHLGKRNAEAVMLMDVGGWR